MKKSNGAAATPGSFSNYQFDFGLGSNLSPGGSSMNDQRNKPSPAVGATSWSSASTGISQPQSSKPPHSSQWFHKPATQGTRAMQDSKPMSMAGDITGKSWVSTSSGSDSGIVGGVGASKADMFSDLLGFNGSVNQKLKPASSSSLSSSSTSISMSSLNSALPLNAMKDKPMGSQSQQQKTSWSSSQDADPFGDFVDASSAGRSKSADFFNSSSSSSSTKNNQTQSFTAAADPFEATFGKAKPAAPMRDPMEDLWKKIPPKPSAQPAAAASTKSGSADDWMKDAEDWNLDAQDSHYEEAAANTTELESLPPPPSGITASIAMDKGFEFQKQGQFADAIKWLTWAVSLATGSSSSLMPKILSGRVSCFKEVGEYKKAVDDCCKVLEVESSNTEILLQRAFLYESMEKYKLGVADLRQVLKSDPSNRLASNTLSRLVKMIE